jgi:hypothetical protein
MFSRMGARFTSKLPEYHIQMTDSKSILPITTYKISNSIYQKIQKKSLSNDYGVVKPETIYDHLTHQEHGREVRKSSHTDYPLIDLDFSRQN